MSKTFKRLGVLVAALALSVSMAGTAFAADLTNGKTGEPSTAITDGVTISKTIVFKNAQSSAVYEPDITYTYTVTAGNPGTPAATVTDGNRITASVKAGVMDAVTTKAPTVIFTNANPTVTASVSGAEDTKTFTIGFDASKFTAPGVYRYVVTETSNPTNVATVGIDERGNAYQAARYLDVYVERNNDNEYEIYGYVLFEGSADQTITTATTKSQGWVKKTDDPDLADVDVYETYDFTISKTITGTMADMTHKFPFTVDVASSITGAYYTLDDTKTAVATTIDKSLGTGETIVIKGMPSASAGLTLTVTETNDTADTYKVKAEIEDDQILAETTVNAAGTAATTALAVTGDDGYDGDTLAFTNTLDAISPTGVVLRYGPFIFMVAAGIALLVVSMRRRRED